jgi:hypothetical protein
MWIALHCRRVHWRFFANYMGVVLAAIPSEAEGAKSGWLY